MAKAEIFYDRQTREIGGASIKPRGWDKESINAMIEGLIASPKLVILVYEFINRRTGEMQRPTKELEPNIFGSLKNLDSEKREQIKGGLVTSFAGSSEAIIMSLPLPNRSQSSNPFENFVENEMS